MKISSNLASVLLVLIAYLALVSIQLSIDTKDSFANQPASNRVSESCHMRELEMCFISAGSMLQNPNGIPITNTEIARTCELFEESANCLLSYAKRCAINSMALLFGMFSGDVLSLEKEFCQPDSKLKRDYLQHASCLKRFQKQHQTQCVTQFQVAFEPIHKIDHSSRIPLFCW